MMGIQRVHVLRLLQQGLAGLLGSPAGQYGPREFGVLSGLAKYLSDSLNSDDVLIQRLSSGLQDCAVHTQPFWSSPDPQDT